MNSEMAYMLGMICGNGQIQRGTTETTVSVEIPHKKLQTEDLNDVAIYVKASLTDIRGVLEPLIGSGISFIQNKTVTVLSFSKSNSDYLIREILRFTGSAVSHENMRIHEEVFSFSTIDKKQFLRGFCDVTGYIRHSNYFIDSYKHRVYIEIPQNWYMVIDICNLLKSIDIPVQNIDWGHPNMRDGNLKKYKEGKPLFWKKEHQIKIFANEFIPIGFGVIHKNKALTDFATELIDGFKKNGVNASEITHRFYWEFGGKRKVKQSHPSEDDNFIPDEIRGNHYDSWKDIARDLGYGE